MKNQIQSLLVALFVVLHTSCFVFAAGKMRLISLTPATTEILFALGLADSIIGVTTYCNYPEEAKTKEKVGSFSSFDYEKIYSLKPDIVFTTGQEQNRVTEQLKKLGIKVYQDNPMTIEETITSILEIGKLTGRNNEAKKITQNIRKKIKFYRKKSEKRGVKPKVFVEIYAKPLMTVAKGSFIDDMINIIGCENVFHNLKLPFCQVSTESVIEKNPEWIVMLSMQNKTDVNNRHWESVDAVKNGKVIDDLNPDIMLRPGPRVIEGMDALYNRIFKDEQ